MLFFGIFFSCKNFCADITLNATYGINNTAQSGSILPLEVNIINRESIQFNGIIVCSVYESNEVIYRYNYNFTVLANGSYNKNIYVSIADRSNTIVVDVFDNFDNKVASQKLNIDLYSLGNKLIIGLITDDASKLQYFDHLSLNNGNIQTTTVLITNESFENNRDILNIVDMLVISGIDSRNISEGLNNQFNKFLSDGKIILIGTGANAGYNIPMPFLKYQQGPSFESEKKINLNGKFTDFNNIYDFIELTTSVYTFDENVNVFDNDGYSLINYRYVGGGVLANAIFDFCDISNIMNNNPIFISHLIENIMGTNRLSQIENNQNLQKNNYQTIRDLISIFESETYPNVINIGITLSIYILILTIVLYSLLRFFKKLKYYGLFVSIISLLFLCLLSIEATKTIKKGNTISFQSITELSDSASREQAFLNITSYDGRNFNLKTSMNNSLYPIVKNNDKAIVVEKDEEIINANKKIIDIYHDENEYLVESSNIKPFDSVLFSYENNNDLNENYPIDISLEFFDGTISGRITNKMNEVIKDSSIVFLGKTIYIGDIKENSSVILNRIDPFNSPIGNNSMQSELMCYYPRTKLIKYYFDNYVFQLLKNAKFFGFIDGNKTLDINSSNIENIDGNTLIVKNIKTVYDKENKTDLCSLDYNLINNRGKYYENNNSIDGNQDVENVYHFDTNYHLTKIYFENLTDYDTNRANPDYNIPYYGSIRVKNLFTEQYDYIMYNDINENELRNYLDENNNITILFSPSGLDILNRKMSLPIIRAIGEKQQ